MSNSISQIQTLHSSFDDITSPIISALQNISSDVRCNELFFVLCWEFKISNSSHQITSSQSIKTIFSIPFTINIQLNSSTAQSIDKQILNSLKQIPLSLDYLTTWTLHRENKSTSSTEGTKPKSTNLTFESNDEKEELEAIQQHFPNHLVDFQDVINPLATENDLPISDQSSATNENNLTTNDIMNEDMIGYLVGIHSRMVFMYLSDFIQKKEEEVSWENELINFQSSSQNQHQNSNSTSTSNSKNKNKNKLNSKKLNKKKSTKSSKANEKYESKEDSSRSLRSYVRRNLLQLLFVGGKVFEVGFSHVMPSQIDQIMKGFGLSILSNISKEQTMNQSQHQFWLLSHTLKR